MVMPLFGPFEDHHDIVDTNEAALLVGVSPITIRSWKTRGWLTPLNPNRKPLQFLERDVIACAAQRMTPQQRAHLRRAKTRWQSSVDE